MKKKKQNQTKPSTQIEEKDGKRKFLFRPNIREICFCGMYARNQNGERQRDKVEFIGFATYLMNILIPVGCIARLIPFHDAIIVYFCLAVSGKRGSGCDGGGGSLGLVAFTPSDFVLDANLPNSQPISVSVSVVPVG